MFGASLVSFFPSLHRLFNQFHLKEFFTWFIDENSCVTGIKNNYFQFWRWSHRAEQIEAKKNTLNTWLKDDDETRQSRRTVLHGQITTNFKYLKATNFLLVFFFLWSFLESITKELQGKKKYASTFCFRVDTTNISEILLFSVKIVCFSKLFGGWSRYGCRLERNFWRRKLMESWKKNVTSNLLIEVLQWFEPFMFMKSFFIKQTC